MTTQITFQMHTHIGHISRVPCTKVLSQSTSGFGFLHHSTDLDEPDKPVTSVFLISQHRKSYKPSKNGAICTSAYLLCAQRFYRSRIFDRTSVHTLIAACIAARSVTKLYRKSNLTACTKVLSIHFCQNCHSFFKLATLKIQLERTFKDDSNGVKINIV